MDNEFWLNIASKNLVLAKEFFIKIGFEVNEKHQSPHMVSLFVGNKNVVLNLFTEDMMQGFMSQPVTNTTLSNEIIFSIGASSPSAVDEMAEKVVAAGGNVFAKPGYTDGWMYGFGFSDLDGHRWNILYMDMSKMPIN